jgi:hypothetical protein
MLIPLFFFPLDTWFGVFYGPLLPDWKQMNLWMCQAIISQAPLKFCFGFVTSNV